jgi:Mg2+-importing ATPase
MIDSGAAPFWSREVSELLRQLDSSAQGLTSAEARRRIGLCESERIARRHRTEPLRLFLSQFKSPIILILLFAAGLSLFLRNPTDASIVLGIVFVSGVLGFWQEKSANDAVAKLLAIVQTHANVLRDGREQEISAEEVVPGDIILLNAGDVIPGDSRILEAKDLFVDEAALTGESYPAEKQAVVVPPNAALAECANALFLGTHVVSGTATAVVVRIGAATEFGKVSGRLRQRPPETEFERGVRRFGYLLMEVTLLLVIAVFAINVFLQRPVLESFLFSLALAVGLTPQLLPAIIAVNLAHGAKRMAKDKVIVKRLASIENFGSMDILCCDKTGTLTEGLVQVDSYEDAEGSASEKVLHYAYLNAVYESGFTNPIDAAIRAYRDFNLTDCEKVDEIPYDFVRKRLSILVAHGATRLLITKGAVKNVCDICSTAELAGGRIVNLDVVGASIQRRLEDLGASGLRALAVAYRDLGSCGHIVKEDETALTFLGFLVFSDPVKSGVSNAIAELQNLGVSFKLVSGDNRHIAAYVGRQVGLDATKIVSGGDLRAIADTALPVVAANAAIFAEVEPQQKERIIMALKKSGSVVGFLGDGINDASALHAADVGISVDSAVDVAKEAADIVLLEKNLAVLAEGVQEGRTTFANTLKYVFMATSANFGNMFSMAGASLFLPFLPLLPKQILLTNVLTDLPEMAIATDRVDRELVQQPRRWDIRFIRKFMIVFGLVSSVFDYVTFGTLLFLLHAGVGEFRTGWFIESVISASMIVLVIRSRRPFFQSPPGRYLWSATLVVALCTLLLPYTFLGRLFGFVPMPAEFTLLLAAILVLYIVAAETVKRIFYQRINF